MPATFQTRAVTGRRRSRAAFTLLEVLLVLALLLLMAGVLVSGASHLFRGNPLTPEDVFWKAVLETRKSALLSGRDVRLSYEGKDADRAFVANLPAGGETRFALDQTGELQVNFVSTQKSTSAILIGGELIETQTIPFVTFYGDGTCSPFRLQIRTGGAARTLEIDPWTCAPVLRTAEKTF